MKITTDLELRGIYLFFKCGGGSRTLGYWRSFIFNAGRDYFFPHPNDAVLDHSKSQKNRLPIDLENEILCTFLAGTTTWVFFSAGECEVSVHSPAERSCLAWTAAWCPGHTWGTSACQRPAPRSCEAAAVRLQSWYPDSNQPWWWNKSRLCGANDNSVIHHTLNLLQWCKGNKIFTCTSVSSRE